MLKEYWIFKNEPQAIIHKVFASNKKDAIKEFEINTGIKLKFTSTSFYQYEVTTKLDWLHYNFRNVSKAVIA